MTVLRPYQAECLDSIRGAWQRGLQCSAVVLPTGSGKTVIFAELATRFIRDDGRRVMVLVHRDELAEQAVSKIKAAAPHLNVGRMQADDHNDTGADVIVASVQTLSVDRRLSDLTGSQDVHGEIGLVIYDELHHSLADSWLVVRDAFAHAAHVGFTATFERGDGGFLTQAWQEVVYTRTAESMIRDGHLVPVNTGRSGVILIDGRADAPRVIAIVLARDMPDRRTIVFCPDVADAQATAAAIGSTASVITGTTDRDVRHKIYEAFRSGTLRVLVSCMVLTEGFDMPEADCAVISRNTKSGPLRTQMIGRVLRPSPGKRDAIVLDVMTTADHHGHGRK